MGDFSSAGSVNFDYYAILNESLLAVTAGGYDFYRGLAAGSAQLGDGVLTAAYDYTTYSGPWQIDENLSQNRFYLSYHAPVGGADATVAVLGYTGKWNSSDQIPRRAVAEGRIDELGFIDPDLGGATDRYSVNAELDFGGWRMRAYVVDYDFTLFSNFTYLLEDPVAGDQFEQTDNRTVYGLRIDGERDHAAFGVPMSVHWGGDIRYDNIAEVALFGTTTRIRNRTIRRDTVDQSSASAYGDFRFQLSESVRAAIGARADYFAWDVDARLAANGGDGDELLVSPKFNLAYRLNDATEFYANWGRGFHSNGRSRCCNFCRPGKRRSGTARRSAGSLRGRRNRRTP